jgi:hypothetical protein
VAQQSSCGPSRSKSPAYESWFHPAIWLGEGLKNEVMKLWILENWNVNETCTDFCNLLVGKSYFNEFELSNLTLC